MIKTVDGSGKDEVPAMREEAAPPPRVRVIETSYVIADPSNFKSIVQSLTGAGAGQGKKAAGRKRGSFEGCNEEAGVLVAAGQSIVGVNLDKRPRCGGDGASSALLKGDSFDEELYKMWVPELSAMEDKHWKWLFNDEDTLYSFNCSI